LQLAVQATNARRQSPPSRCLSGRIRTSTVAQAVDENPPA